MERHAYVIPLGAAGLGPRYRPLYSIRFLNF
jgi:hypothetical protein